MKSKTKTKGMQVTQITRTVYRLLLTAYCLLLLTTKSSAAVSINVATSSNIVLSGNSVLVVPGNIIVDGSFIATESSNIKFCGTSLQQIGGSSGISTFQNLELNNSANFKLLGDVTVNGTITLTNGIVSTGTKTLILSETASFSPASGSATSFIDGKIKKTGNNAAFTFPVGDIQDASIVWAPVEIAAWNNQNDFTVHYTFKSPFDSLGYPTWQDGSSLASGLDNVSGNEFWLLNRTGAGTQTPNVKLYWKDAVRSEIANTESDYQEDALTDLALVHWNGTQWENLEGTAVAETWPTGYIQNSINFTDYSPITFGSKTGINPLFIELIAFNANCSKKCMQLNWETASEINNNFFTIERSTDIHNWEVVDTVNGAGNSNQPLQYSHTDANVSEEEVYYYRLGNTDFNGVTEYSNIIAANCKNESFGIISICPNPVVDGDMRYIVYSSENTEVEAFVTNVLGQVLAKEKLPVKKGTSLLSMDVSHLNNAIYFFKVSTTNGLYKDCKQLIIDK